MVEPFALSSSIVRKYSEVEVVADQIKKTTAPKISIPPMTNLLIFIIDSNPKPFQTFEICIIAGSFYMSRLRITEKYRAECHIIPLNLSYYCKSVKTYGNEVKFL